jgi:hypothetical protein
MSAERECKDFWHFLCIYLGPRVQNLASATNLSHDIYPFLGNNFHGKKKMVVQTLGKAVVKLDERARPINHSRLTIKQLSDTYACAFALFLFKNSSAREVILYNF